MCEDWITEKYIDDVRNAAKKNYAAIKRVRELAKSYDTSGDQDLWRVAQDIYQALDGDK
jgi:hypothetical protein